MGSNYSNVALLPIKAHSERVTGKNFREFAGKPLCRWIHDSLLEVEFIDQIVINTDARELLAQHGVIDSDRVTIRDRKPGICGDFVSMNQILWDDIQNVPADTYLMTHATNPLLRPSTIAAALNRYHEGVAAGTHDSLFTVTQYQARFYGADGSAINHDPDNLLRTQDLEPWFEENSNLYIFSKDSFQSTEARIGRTPVLFETPRLESFDIDDFDGWNLAEIVAKSNYSGTDEAS